MTETMTIQVAMSEIKTIAKRFTAKKTVVTENCCRPSYMTDMLEKEGGATEFIRREMQSATDLHARLLKLRVAVQRKNTEAALTVAGKSRVVAEWLTWRKEVAAQSKSFWADIVQKTNATKQQVERQQLPSGQAATLTLHYDFAAATKALDDIEKQLGELDGALSVFNATNTVTIE